MPFFRSRKRRIPSFRRLDCDRRRSWSSTRGTWGCPTIWNPLSGRRGGYGISPCGSSLLVAGGSWERIGKMVADLGLDNVRFLPYQPKEKLRYSLTCSDVSMVCLDRGVEGLSVPSKYYGILASGRPVIALMAGHSEVAMSIRESGCGYVVPPGNPDALADRIRYLFDHPDVAREMGKKSRESLERSYSRRIVARKYLELLREVSA